MKKPRPVEETGRGGDPVCLRLRSGANHLRHASRQGRMMMVMMMPNRRHILHDENLPELRFWVNPDLHRGREYLIRPISSGQIGDLVGAFFPLGTPFLSPQLSSLNGPVDPNPGRPAA